MILDMVCMNHNTAGRGSSARYIHGLVFLEDVVISVGFTGEQCVMTSAAGLVGGEQCASRTGVIAAIQPGCYAHHGVACSGRNALVDIPRQHG